MNSGMNGGLKDNLQSGIEGGWQRVAWARSVAWAWNMGLGGRMEVE